MKEKILLFGHYQNSKANYKSVYLDIEKNNYTILRILSLVITILAGIYVIFYEQSGFDVRMSLAFTMSAISLLLFLLLSFHVIKHRIYIWCYIFITMIYTYTLLIGTVFASNNSNAVLTLIILAGCGVITFRNFYFHIIYTVFLALILCILSFATKDYSTAVIDMWNAVPCAIIGIAGNYLTAAAAISGFLANKLLQSETEQIHELLENVPGGVCVLYWDKKELKFITVSNNFLKLHGIDPNNEKTDLMSANLDDYIMEEDIPSFKQALINGIFNTNELNTMYRIRNSSPIKWIKVNAVAIPDKNGGKLCYANYSDITAEMEVAAAKQANEAKSDFLARMSHDIRTPLNAVLGITELAFDEVESPEATRQYLKQINESGKFLRDLVNDILDMSKIESNKFELVPEPYAFRDFIDVMKTMFQVKCEQKNITLEMETGVPNCIFMVDKLRLDQIFLNLMSNAVKFTPSGGKVCFLIRNHRADDNSFTGDFIVKDSGIGMSNEFQQQLFTPFSQEHHAVTSHEQGTGLGLSIVKKIIDVMGGSIEITSEQGEGTTVKVHLTLKLCQDANAIQSSSQKIVYSDEIFENKHVLVVEDNQINIEIAKKILQKKKVQVTTAENGAHGLEIFEKSAEGYFDAILMDVRMPIMDGITATKEIRALLRTDAMTIPIIAMTANAFTEDKANCITAGMNEHLAKPVNPAKIYETLAQFFVN